MAQRSSHVPRFGNWENEDNVPYTAYFDKARKGRTAGKIINPNDPQEMDGYADEKRQVPASPLRNKVESEIPVREELAKPGHSRHSSREDGSLRRITGSPARNENAGRKAPTDPAPRVPSSRDVPQRRAGRLSGGSEHSIEGSPLHQNYQARAGGRGGGSGHASPAWEKKTTENSHGQAPNTPGRSRFARGDQTPDRSAAVPKFGEWDENNPASADGFTHIFDKMREEKHTGAAEVPTMPSEPSRHHKQVSSDTTSCFCFSWGKK